MKIVRLILLLLFASVSPGCNNQLPNEIIGTDQMAEILFDISLAESYTESFLLKDTSLRKDSVYESEINKVMQFHKITPELFSKSYTYYTKKPVLFKEVMDSANARALRYKDDAIIIDSKRVKN